MVFSFTGIKWDLFNECQVEKAIHFAPCSQVLRRNQIRINSYENTAPSIEAVDNNRWKLLLLAVKSEMLPWKHYNGYYLCTPYTRPVFLFLYFLFYSRVTRISKQRNLYFQDQLRKGCSKFQSKAFTTITIIITKFPFPFSIYVGVSYCCRSWAH